jgi:hypothetical protein
MLGLSIRVPCHEHGDPRLFRKRTRLEGFTSQPGFRAISSLLDVENLHRSRSTREDVFLTFTVCRKFDFYRLDAGIIEPDNNFAPSPDSPFFRFSLELRIPDRWPARDLRIFKDEGHRSWALVGNAFCHRPMVFSGFHRFGKIGRGSDLPICLKLAHRAVKQSLVLQNIFSKENAERLIRSCGRGLR